MATGKETAKEATGLFDPDSMTINLDNWDWGEWATNVGKAALVEVAHFKVGNWLDGSKFGKGMKSKRLKTGEKNRDFEETRYTRATNNAEANAAARAGATASVKELSPAPNTNLNSPTKVPDYVKRWKDRAVAANNNLKNIKRDDFKYLSYDFTKRTIKEVEKIGVQSFMEPVSVSTVQDIPGINEVISYDVNSTDF
jgi:hypothetical protein